MDPNDAVNAGTKLLGWFTDYGALQILALGGLLWPVFIVGFLVWLVKKYGVAISEMVTLLRELRKERANGN